METKHIKDFIALAEFGSSYDAAAQLFVSQSTLVRHIQAFEEEFGVQLFDRTRTGFVLNEAGEIFLTYAKKIALEQEQCRMALRHEDENSTVVRVCAIHKIMDLIIEYHRKYPQYTVEFMDPVHADIKLREGLIDVAFISEADNVDDELVILPYITLQLMVLVNEKNPLASQKSVSIEELKKENIISMVSDVITYSAVVEQFGRAGFKPNVTLTVPNGKDMIEMVQEGFGIAMMHGTAENVPEHEGIKTLPIEPPIEIKVKLVYRNSSHLSPAVLSFVELAKKHQIRHQKTNLTLL